MVDKRTANTKRSLVNALYSLLQDKSISDINVRELCEAAKINRGTFYKYYKNVYDMVTAIENRILSDLEKTLEDAPLAANPDLFVYDLLQLINNSREVSRLVFRISDRDFTSKIVSLMRDSTINYWKERFGCNDEKLLGDIFIFVSHGIIAMVGQWIENNDFKDSPHKMANDINHLGDSCVTALAGDGR